MIDKDKVKSAFLIFVWALYDLANQFFALNVVSLYFVRWVTIERNTPEIFYSISYGLSTFLVAISAPILGTISDLTGRRRPFLFYLTLLSILFTSVLGKVNSVLLGLIFFAIANFGCQSAIVFYNALMVDIAPPGRVGLVSGLGKMFGYCGAVLGIYLIRPLVLRSGYQAAFFPTGMLFLIFSLPCILFIKDRSRRKIELSSFLNKQGVRDIFITLRQTAFNAKEFPGLLDFLKAAFFGLSVVNAIILFMAIYATRAFGLGEIEISNLIALSTLFAIAGSFLSGYLSDHIGYKRSLVIIFLSWAVCLLCGALIRQSSLFWFIGALVGATLGATWVVSRAMVIRLVPANKIGEVFGLFNLVGYLSGIVGSLFWGGMLLLLSPLGEYGYRITVLSLIVFLAFALVFLRRVPKEKNIIR